MVSYLRVLILHVPRKFALNIKHTRVHAWTPRAQHWLDSTRLSPRNLLRLRITQHNPRCIVRSLISQCCDGWTDERREFHRRARGARHSCEGASHRTATAAAMTFVPLAVLWSAPSCTRSSAATHMYPLPHTFPTSARFTHMVLVTIRRCLQTPCLKSLRR